MCSNGCAKLSLQKGNLLTVHISVSYKTVLVTIDPLGCILLSGTYRLQSLLDLCVQGTSLDGNDLRSSIRIVGNRRATLRTEDTVDSLPRAS